MKSSVILFLLGLLVVTSVHSQDDAEGEDSSWVSEKMPFTYQNIQVPREMWNLVKDALREKGAKEEQIENFAIHPTSVSIEVTAQERNVLKEGKNYKLLFIEGGGDLDLFKYISGRGQFHLRFSPHLVNGKDYHLFYLSDSPGKAMEGDQWGNGCGQIYDLSNSAHKFLGGEGMLLTTSKRHYLHLMAGVFVFFQLVDERLYLGYIRVMDSRYPNFNCKNS